MIILVVPFLLIFTEMPEPKGIKHSKLYKVYSRLTNYTGKSIVILLISLFIASIAGLLILKVFFTLGKDTFEREIGIALLQLITVGVIGTILSMLLASYNLKQEEVRNEAREKDQKFLRDQELTRIADENKNQYRKDILKKLNEIYTGTKGARRMLRAKGFKADYKKVIKTAGTTIDLKHYDDFLERINGFELGLDIFSKELDTNKNIFSRYKCIDDNIEKMKEYLYGFVEEYENNRWRFTGEPPSVALDYLPVVSEMLAHADKDNLFKTRFITPYKTVFTAVRNELLNIADDNQNTP